MPSVPQPRLPQNDAYEGSVVAGKLTPRFVWEASTVEVGEVRYELQYATDREFTAGLVTVEVAEPRHQPAAALAVATTPPVGRRYYWRVRACAGEKCSEYSRPWWVNLGRSIKDFNGDGYDDVLVGAHAPTGLGSITGKAFAYYGGPGTTFNAVADGMLYSTDPLGWAGYSVSSAGDFNGDGFADVIIGMPKSDNGEVDSGQTFLVYGKAGSTLGSVVDIYFLGSTEAGALFGRSVSSAGDVNGDGYSDVIVGAPGGTIADAYLYLGSANPILENKIMAPSASIKSARTASFFGDNVSGIGDLNGDGFADISMSASGYLASDVSEVCASEIYLGAADFDVEKDGDIMGATNEKCSLRAGKSGDLNGDGFSDVIAKINGRSEGMRIFLGGKTIPKSADMTFAVAVGNRSREVAGVGDVNGDGADDVACAENITSTNPFTAKITVYLGRLGAERSVLAESPAAVIPSPIPGGTFGWSIGAAGDVNGDSFDDFVTGQQDFNSTGRALVYFGNGGATLDMSADGAMSSGEEPAFFGFSVH